MSTTILDINLEFFAQGKKRSIRFATDEPMTGLIGPSGAGKSTVAKMITGALSPSKGHIQVRNNTLFDHQSKQNIPPYKRRVAWVPQSPGLFPHMTIAQNLAYGQRSDIKQTHASQIIENLSLGHLLKRAPYTLSGGEARRVSVARALLSQPELILLDEPTTGLDRHTAESVLQQIASAIRHENIAALFITHIYNDLALFTGNAVLMHAFKVITSGRLETVLAHPATRQLVDMDDAGVVLSFGQGIASGGLPAAQIGDQIIRFSAGANTPDAPFRARIKGRDIALALGPMPTSSIQNILDVCVEHIDRGVSESHVRLALPGTDQKLLALVTNQSAETLGLRHGQQIKALIKASAIHPIMETDA